MINSRDINELHPEVRQRCQALIDGCRHVGIDLIVTSTFRDNESQAALFAQGRTAPGKRVTNARPGQSFHNYRLAFDVVPLIAGKCCWSDTLLWRKIGEIGKNRGLEWAGDWVSFKEYPHFQWTGGLTLKDLQEGRLP